jgi:hypothetical protein
MPFAAGVLVYSSLTLRLGTRIRTLRRFAADGLTVIATLPSQG